MDLIDIFKTWHPNAEYTFFSSVHETFSWNKPNLIMVYKLFDVLLNSAC